MAPCAELIVGRAEDAEGHRVNRISAGVSSSARRGNRCMVLKKLDEDFIMHGLVIGSK